MFSLNFRNRLLFLQFLTVIMTAVLLGGGSHLLFVSALEKMQDRHLSHLVSEGAEAIAANLRERELQMKGLDMESFRQRYGELPLEKHFLEYFRELPEKFPAISLLDHGGDEVVKLIKGQAAESYYNYQYDTAVQQARRHPNQMHVGFSINDPQTGQPVIHLAYTYVSYFGEQFLGTLLVTLPLEQFDRQLITIARDDGASLALLSAEGKLLTFHRPEIVFQDLPMSLEEKPTRYKLFGEDLVLASAQVRGGSFQVLATVPWGIYRAEVNKMRVMAVLICLVVTLVSALISWKLTSILTRNIGLLVEFAERVGHGDYQQQLPYDSCEEFNRLNNAFNRMVVDLASHRQSRDSLQRIVETIIDPLIVVDKQGMVVQINQAGLKLFSCDSAKILNRPLADLFPETPTVLRRAEFSSGLLNAHVENLETVIRSCHGAKVPVLFSSAPCGRASEEFGVVCILKDVTELMAVRDSREKALILAEEARRKIDVLLRSVPDGLVVTDLQGDIQLMNVPAEKLLGNQFVGRVKDIVTQLSKESGDIGAALEISLPCNRSGEVRVIQAHASAIYGSQNQVNGMVMLLRDVSRERSLDQMKNEFISTAAHELRTPLTSILGYSELLLDPVNQDRFSLEEQHDFLQEILGRAETLSRMIDDLLSISRIESGQPLSLELAPADIALVIERVIRQVKLTSKSHRYELNLSKNGGLSLVDTGRLQQALENLLSNAVKYSAEDSLISVSGGRVEGCYRIVIEDQGIGMLPEQQAKVFEKFYRVDYSDTKTSGLGIGMSIVKQIIDGHGGKIEIMSNLGEGTRVELSFPVPESLS